MSKVTDPDEWGYCRKSGVYVKKRDHDRECSNKCDIVTSRDEVDGECNDGCYITTAVCSAYGMDDKCEVLETLRHFRDNYMLVTLERKNLVRLYYKTAPDIVNFINKRSDRDKIYQKLMRKYILPSFQQIKIGNPEEAFEIYKKGILFAMNIVNN